MRERAALSIYSTLLGGSMGSRLFDEIREKRGLCYSVYAITHAFADVPILQLGSGLESAKCIEAYTRMREIVDELRDGRPDRGGGQRARAYAAGRLVLAFENTNAVARYAANQTIVFGESIDPDAAIAALDAVTFDEVHEVAGRRRRRPRRCLRRTAHGRGVLALTLPPRDAARRATPDRTGTYARNAVSFAIAGESAPAISLTHSIVSPRSIARASTIASMSTQSRGTVEHRLEHGESGAVEHGDRAPFERDPTDMRLDVIVKRQHAQEQVDGRDAPAQPDLAVAFEPARGARR